MARSMFSPSTTARGGLAQLAQLFLGGAEAVVLADDGRHALIAGAEYLPQPGDNIKVQRVLPGLFQPAYLKLTAPFPMCLYYTGNLRKCQREGVDNGRGMGYTTLTGRDTGGFLALLTARTLHLQSAPLLSGSGPV